MRRLATLIANAAGIVDIYRQTTYAGGIIPRDDKGLMLSQINAGRVEAPPQQVYESLCIRLTGGFDD